MVHDAPAPHEEEAILAWAPPSAMWMKLPAGQVLLYRGHVPPGVFVALSGTLRMSGAGGPDLALHAPCLVPDPHEMHRSCERTVVLSTDIHALFLPRSVVLTDPRIAARLDDCQRRWGLASAPRTSPEKR